MSSKYNHTLENTSVETKLVYIKPINFLKSKRQCSENEVSLLSHNNCFKISSNSSSFIDRGFELAKPILNKLKMSKIKTEECHICFNEISFAYQKDILKCNSCKVKYHYNCMDTLNKMRNQKKSLFKSSLNFTCDVCLSLGVNCNNISSTTISHKKSPRCTFCKRQSKGLFLFNDYLAHLYCNYIGNYSKNKSQKDYKKYCCICNQTDENQLLISIPCKIKSCQSIFHLNCWLDSNSDKLQLLHNNLFYNFSLDCCLFCDSHKFDEKEINCKFIHFNIY